MKNKVIATFTLLIAGLTGVFAQATDDPKYGETPEIREECLKALSLYREFRDQKNIDDAFDPWRTAYDICPKAAKTLYTDGVDFYAYKIKNSDDGAEQNAFLDSLLAVYDKRIVHFGEKGKVLGYKGTQMFKYRSNQPLKAYKVLKEAVEISKERTQPGVLDIYYRTMFEAFKNGEIEREDLLTEYLVISEYIDQGRSKTKEAYYKYYDKAKDNINEYFVLIAQCEDINPLAKKKFEEAPNDPENIKKLAKIMTKRECTESETFIKIAKKLNEIEPSHESSYTLGVALLKQAKYGESLTYFKKAIELSPEDNTELESYYLAAGGAAAAIGQNATANTYARKALEINGNSGKAYMLIGDAIAGSASSCGGNEFETKAVYWLAVDYYQKAKSVDPDVASSANSKIGSYSARFPDKKLMFQYSMVDGSGNAKKEPVKIGCWINQEVMPRL